MNFESSDHYFFYIRKMLANKGVKFPDDALRKGTDKFYNLDDKELLRLYSIGLRDPRQILTWRLRNGEYESIGEVADEFVRLWKEIETLMKSDEVDMEVYGDMFKLHPVPDFLEMDGFKETSPDFQDDMQSLRFKPGIYFLYNGKNKLVYIGKSQDLGSRIPSSAREREAHKYSYAITNSYSDAGIYEMYFISLHKPPKNVEGKYPDEPTITLPELTVSEINSIYKGFKKVT